ncbi:hypothetical protein H113_05609 [Trichophyton rubrum MR1459]|nr:hypothetical protein H113_05609 [Trichophyton rubrum MR1459]
MPSGRLFSSFSVPFDTASSSHPGCKSICGGIGTYPHINFVSSQQVSAGVEVRYVCLKARKEDEETSEYMKSIIDPNQWITPQPPFQRF